MRTNISAFIRDGEEFEDGPCDTPACLCAELDSLSLCYLWEVHSLSLVWGPAPISFNVGGTWSRSQAVWIWEKLTAINGFPEKIPKCIIHTDSFKWGEWLCFLTRLSVVSCLCTEGTLKFDTTTHHTVCGWAFCTQICVCIQALLNICKFDVCCMIMPVKRGLWETEQLYNSSCVITAIYWS